MAKGKTVKGVIAEVASKPFNDNKTGEPITLHSFKIEGSNQWYRTGQNPIQFGAGDSVQFVADGQKVDVSSLEATSEPVQQAPAPTAVSTATSGKQFSSARPTGKGVSRDEYWANKEKRDIEKDERYQKVDIPRMTMSTAVSSASQVVASAVESDALKLGNLSTSKRVDLMVDYVEQIADRLYDKIVAAGEAGEKPESVSTSNDLDEGE